MSILTRRLPEKTELVNGNFTDTAGRSHPLGATPVAGGVNFSIYSRDASKLELLFFDREDDGRPARVIPIDPAANRTYHYWHMFVPGATPGQIYGFRVHGPFEPERGLRFDPTKLLLDPYGRAVVVPKNYSRIDAGKDGDNTATAMKSVVVDPRRIRLGRRHAAKAAILANHHL